MFKTIATTLWIGFIPFASTAGVLQTDWPSDLNGDGKVSLGEMQTACRTVVMAADTDTDGQISVREWAVAAKTMRQRAHDLGLRGWRPASDDIFVRVDTDRDGFVTAAEVDAAAIRRFNRRDANRDGFITFDEASRGDQYASQP